MMRAFLISLTIFCAFSWTGLALKCLQCLNRNGNTCKGVSVKCPKSVKNCMVVSELYQAYNDTFHSIKKDCNVDFPCNTTAYLSNFNDKSIRINVQCCSKSKCNTQNYNMPPQRSETVGPLCSACFGDGMKECISNCKTLCLKKEDKCLDFIGRLVDPGNNTVEHNFKGCISPLICKYQLAALIGLQAVQIDRFVCSP